MKSISNINLLQLHTDECLGFLVQVAGKANLVTLQGDQGVINSFRIVVDSFDKVLKPTMKNSFTGTRKEADEIADSLWTGLKMNVKSMTYHPNEDVVETATRVYEIIEKYGVHTRMNYKEQYPNLKGMLNDLNDLSSEDISLLNLAVWVEALQNAYDNFMSITADSVAEESQKEVGIVQECRDNAEQGYYELVSRINAGAIYNGAEPYEPFIDTVNVIVDEYKAHILGRKTRNAKKRAEDSKQA